MSLLLLEGFDDGEWDSRWSTFSVATGVGTNDAPIGQSFITDRDVELKWTLPTGSADDTVTVGFWCKLEATIISTAAEGNAPFRYRDGSTIHLNGRVTATGAIAMYRGSTLLGTSDAIFTAGSAVAHYIEIQMTIHDSTGAITIMADNTEVLALTGIDTQNGGAAEINVIEFHEGTDDKTRIQISDIYVTNEVGDSPYNSFLGPLIVETLFPDGNGTDSDFTGSDADSTDNYLHVDESPTHDSDTSYVESTTNTNRDTYTFGALVSTTGALRGIMATAVAKHGGGGDNILMSTRPIATDHDSSAYALTAAYAPVDHVWQISPETSSAWTIAEVNDSEFGIENTS